MLRGQGAETDERVGQWENGHRRKMNTAGASYVMLEMTRKWVPPRNLKKIGTEHDEARRV